MGWGLGCFPDSFQRTKVGELCCWAENSTRLLQILLYLVLSLAHSFWLNKVSSFPVSWSLITSLRAFCFEALDWPKEGHLERGLVVLEIFSSFLSYSGKTIQCAEKAQVFILV